MNINWQKIIKLSTLLFVIGFIFFANSNTADAAVKEWSGTASWTSGGTNWGADGCAPSCTGSAFLSGDAAEFAGTAGVVTVSGAQPAVSLTFAVTGYTLSGGTMTGTAAPLTINLCNGCTETISTVLGGTNITVAMTSGSGTLILSGQNTFTGILTISSGVTVKLGANGGATNSPLGTIGTGAAGRTEVSSGGALDFNGFRPTIPENITLNGTGIGGSGSVAGTGALLNSATTGTGAAFIGKLVLASDSSVMTGSSGNGTMVLSTGTVTGAFRLILGGTGTGTFSKPSNTGTLITGLDKTGTGSWTLGGLNTYTGTTIIYGGTLKMGSAGSATQSPLGTTAGGTTICSTCTLDLNGYALTAAVTREPLTLSGTGVGGAGAITNSVATAATFGGPITLSAAATIFANSGNMTLNTATNNVTLAGFALTLAGTNGNSSLTGTVTSSGSGSVIKDGTGSWIMSGSNTYSGGLTIKMGTIIANKSNNGTVSGIAGPSTSAITLGDSAGGSASLIANSFTVSNNINLGANAVGTLTIGNNTTTTAPTFSGAIALGGNDLTIRRQGTTGTITVSSNITGTGDITLDNSGTTSTMGITGGNINNIGSITGTGTSSGLVTIGSTIGTNVKQIIASSNTSALTVSGAITNDLTDAATEGIAIINNSLSTPVLSITGGIANGSGSGTTVFQNNGTTTSGITVSTAVVASTGAVRNSGTGTGSVLVSTQITAAGSAALSPYSVNQNSSTSALVLSGTANTYVGTTTISLGTLQAASTSSLGAGSQTSNILEFNGGTLQATGTITSPSTRPVTLNSTALIDTNGQNITLNGNISGAGGITKSGTGTLTLGGTTKTLGDTLTVSAGTVTNTTSTLTGTALSVSNNAVFTQGTGAVSMSGNVTIGGGTNGTYSCLPGAGSFSVGGNLLLNTDAIWTDTNCGTLIFNKGSTGQTVTSNALNPDLGNVQISANGGNTTLSLGSNITLTNLTIDASQVLDVTSAPYNITVNGNWTNNGGTAGFVEQTGTVFFKTNSTAVITGTTDFYNFNVTGI